MGWVGNLFYEHCSAVLIKSNTGTKVEEDEPNAASPRRWTTPQQRFLFKTGFLKQADTFRDATKRSWNNNDAPTPIKLLKSPPQSMGCQDDETLHH